MRIHARKNSRRIDRITLNLASMIDVTFLLLIYFMVTTIIAAPEDRLSPTLQTQAEEGASRDNDFQPQIVEVLVLDGAPAYRLGSRVLPDRAALAEALSGLPTDPGLFIRVYGGVPVGFAVTALQVGRDAGFDQVTYVPSE